jgi:ubiquinone/menaquinone biosynthesis C-methylase UbiE
MNKPEKGKGTDGDGDRAGRQRRGPGHKRGPSSYHMIGPDQIFYELQLKPGDTFLDLGCGLGDYSMATAGIIGDEGIVFALEKQERLVTDLKSKAHSRGLHNINPMVSDMTRPLPLEDASMDVCLISTVLHIPEVSRNMNKVFVEVRRVLKPKAHLVVVECHKEEMSFGPPLSMRLSPDEIELVAVQCGFKRVNYADLGFYYLIKFIIQSASGKAIAKRHL